MELMNWTDERMDDLKSQVVEMDRRIDTRLEQVDRRFEHLEERMDEGFRELRVEMREMRTEMNTRFGAMLRVMIVFGASMFAAMLGLIATQL
jgi:hypothetical protein